MKNECFLPFAAGTLALLASLGAPAMAQTCGTSNLNYTGFSAPGSNQFTLVGGSFYQDDLLYLTDFTSGLGTAAWFNGSRIKVSDGFVATFTFRIDGQADGFAFVIQDDEDGLGAVGWGGSSMGYGAGGDREGIRRSIAIEFDTFGFGPPFEAPTPHVAIHTRGAGENDADDSAALVISAEQPLLLDGQSHTATITYASGQMTVALDGTPVVGPIAIDFNNIGGDSILQNGECGRVGFVGATGGFTGNQIIESFSLSDDGSEGCVPTNIELFDIRTEAAEGETVVFTIDGPGSFPRNYRWVLNGVDLVDGGSISGAETATLTISPVGPEHQGQLDFGFDNECSGVGTGFFFTVIPAGPTCDYDFNRDENVDLTDAQQMAQVFVGLLAPDPAWLDGDLNGDENADLTDAQILALYVVSGSCPF